jgi:hypothetical protein
MVFEISGKVGGEMGKTRLVCTFLLCQDKEQINYLNRRR